MYSSSFNCPFFFFPEIELNFYFYFFFFPFQGGKSLFIQLIFMPASETMHLQAEPQRAGVEWAEILALVLISQY